MGPPEPFRRPADLRAEWRGPRSGDPAPRSWPVGFVSAPADRSALLVLLGLAALTPRRLLEVAETRRTARGCLEAVLAGEAGSDGDQRVARATDPDRIATRVEAGGARLVAVGESGYPAQLLDLFDPPAGLFVVGDSLAREPPYVAMVGARNCSQAGKDAAQIIARGLSRAGVRVVSGAARGIDQAAHEGALDGPGGTVAVLGSGIDMAYPPRNRKLLSEIAASGSVVSEYPPGIPAEPFRFPARNRIVAALSRAVVIVEGAKGSGSMITADHALEIGREVFAVPGTVTSPLSAIPHKLIRQGATLIRGPEDLLEDLGLQGSGAAPSDPTLGMDPSARAVWDALTTATLPDQLAATCGLAVSQVISSLVALELRGLVRQAGGRYERRLVVADR